VSPLGLSLRNGLTLIRQIKYLLNKIKLIAMKKNEYMAPEMEIIKLNVASSLMVISTGGPTKSDEIIEDEE